MELKGGPGSRRFDYKQKLLLKATRKRIFLRPQMYKGKRSLKGKKKAGAIISQGDEALVPT